MTTTYTIGDLAKEFDLTTRAIRFYEDLGLLQPERSGPGGRSRVYTGRDRTRLKLTLRAKRLGLSLTEAKDIIDMYDSPRDTGAQMQKFLDVLGLHRKQVEELVELALPYSDKVTQQQDGFHGGAMGALADIAGGYAGLTVAADGMEVTTVEYKINFLAAFQGGELRATGRVVKAGRRIIVTTAEVAHVDADGKHSACAVMQQTLVPVPKTY